MISEATGNRVRAVLALWAQDHKIQPAAVTDLFSRLSEVEGNRAFKNTISFLRMVIRERGL